MESILITPNLYSIISYDMKCDHLEVIAWTKTPGAKMEYSKGSYICYTEDKTNNMIWIQYVYSKNSKDTLRFKQEFELRYNCVIMFRAKNIEPFKNHAIGLGNDIYLLKKKGLDYGW